MAHAHMPPVPPAGRSDKGPGDSPPPAEPKDVKRAGNRPVPDNLAEQGQQGNTHQNTTHPGIKSGR